MTPGRSPPLTLPAMPPMTSRAPASRWSWAARFAWRQRLKGSLWFVPLLCAVAGPLLAQAAIEVDAVLEPRAAWTYTGSTASTVLSAIVGAMVGLTGFVVAFGVLVMQLATQTLSPRFMRLWYRDPLQKAVLGTFVGTLTFALALLREVRPASVPDIGVTIAAIAVTASVVLFLVYLDRFVHSLRPVAVAWTVAGAGIRVFEEMEWISGDSEPDPPAGEPSLVVCSGASGMVQAIDAAGLLAIASRHDVVVTLPLTVGDFVGRGGVLMEVHGQGAVPAGELRGRLALGEERTIDQDPAFALRILVDIAIRALSPAVNDPTTAVQILGPLEDLLLVMGQSRLSSPGLIRDAGGAVRVRVHVRRWDDLLALALTEIRDYGATSVQVSRRMRALLENLWTNVRPEHRPAVAAQLTALDEALGRLIGEPLARHFAAHADLQGIGGADGDRA
jgi:uncharacterized membrane protein